MSPTFKLEERHGNSANHSSVNLVDTSCDIATRIRQQELDHICNLLGSRSPVEDGFVGELKSQITVDSFHQGGLDKSTAHGFRH
jgi:hypothetical protein